MRDRTLDRTSARRSGAPSRSRASPRWRRRSSRRRASSSTRSSTSSRSTPSARSSRASKARSCGYDLLILVPPHKGQQFLIDSGLAAGPRRLAADRSAHAPGRRSDERLRARRRDGPAAFKGRFDGPLRGAGRGRADRRGDRGPGTGRQARRLPGQGDVLLRDRRRERGRCCNSTMTTHPARQSRTSSGTWESSSSTRRTGTRCPRVASDPHNIGPPTRPLPRAGGLVDQSPAGMIDHRSVVAAGGREGCSMRVPLTIAVAQPLCRSDDVASNIVTHVEAIRVANARVIVFPELSLTGYELDAPSITVDDPRLAPIVAACAETGTVALVGAPLDGDGQMRPARSSRCSPSMATA